MQEQILDRRNLIVCRGRNGTGITEWELPLWIYSLPSPTASRLFLFQSVRTWSKYLAQASEYFPSFSTSQKHPLFPHHAFQIHGNARSRVSHNISQGRRPSRRYHRNCRHVSRPTVFRNEFQKCQFLELRHCTTGRKAQTKATFQDTVGQEVTMKPGICTVRV